MNLPSDLKWAAPGSRSAGTTVPLLPVLALCITLGRPSVEAHAHWTQRVLGDPSMGGQLSLSFSPAEPPHTFGYSSPDDKQTVFTFSL